LADAIKGRAYPTTTVKVYLDDASAMELVEVNDLMNRTTNPEALIDLEKRSEFLAEKIMESSLTFEMRGIGQKEIDQITEQLNGVYSISKGQDGTTNPEWLKDYITLLVGRNIISVTNAEGAVDKSEFDLDKTTELRSALSLSEWNKLVGAMQKLTLAGGYFDQLTDAGFLQKS